MNTTAASRSSFQRKLASVFLVLAVIASLMAVYAPVASASIDITIPITTKVHAQPGSQTLLASVPTGDQEGLECSVTAESLNQSSVHPDNDLIVASGGGSVLLDDVEGTAGGVVEADGTLTLGPVVTVTLVMGPDHQFSAGITIFIDCTPETTTTTTEATTTTTEATTTTTEAPDVPQIDLVKTPNTSTVVAPGADVTFTVDVSNPSATVAVTITSLVDDVYGTLAGDDDCKVGTTLAPLGACSFDFVGFVGGVAGDQHHNTVTVNGEDDSDTEVLADDDAVVDVVDGPTVVIDVFGVCENDTPFVSYQVSTANFFPEDQPLLTVHWYDTDDVEHDPADPDVSPDPFKDIALTDQGGGVWTASDTVLWPGARVDAQGNPTDWPGWVFEDGSWTQTDDGFEWARNGSYLIATVNPTSEPTAVFYPPATPECNPNPPTEVLDVEVLPFTGIQTELLVAAGLFLLASGVLMLTVPARREES